MFNKVLSLILLIALSVSPFRVNQRGPVLPYLGSTSAWYSDASSIGVMSNSSSSGKGYRYISNNWSSSTFAALCNNAKIAWGQFGSFYYTSGNDYKITLAEVTRSEATSHGVPLSACAVTTYNNVTAIGEVFYGTQAKEVDLIAKSNILLIYETNNLNTANYTMNQLKTVVTHEWGHALGYFGHDTNANANNKAIMYPYAQTLFDWNLTTTKPRDIAHLNISYSI